MVSCACCLSLVVSRLWSRLVPNILNIDVQVLLLLHRDRDTRVPAYEHSTLPTGQRYLFENNIVDARRMLKHYTVEFFLPSFS